MGYRRIQPGAMTGIHRFGNQMLTWLASLLYQRRCRDLCTGMWGFQASALDALPLESTGFELEAEMFAHAARLGLRIEQVQADYLPRVGSSKLGFTDGFRIAWSLLRSRFDSLDGTSRSPPTRRGPVQEPKDPPSCSRTISPQAY
jgi:dolichol-phosphate mannosyltransferase